jgi:hypothetical protein
MLRRIRFHLTYANIAATAALILALAAAVTFTHTVQATPTTGTWFLAGTFSDLPACTGCEVSLAPSGESSMGTPNNSSNQLLSPNVPIVASHFSVHIETAPGSGTRKFFLTSHSDIAQSLHCQITGANTTCDSGAQTLTIAPGTRIFVDVANLSNAPPTKLQLSWLATPQ